MLCDKKNLEIAICLYPILAMQSRKSHMLIYNLQQIIEPIMH